MKLLPIIVGVGVFVGLGAVVSGLYLIKAAQIRNAPPPMAMPPQAVEVVKAEQIMWNPTADLVGTVFSLRSVRVSNELAGRVTGVKFESGQIVEPGSTLLTFDDSTDEADLEAARASVRVAEANARVVDTKVALAKTELGRLESGGARAVSAMDLDRSRSEVQTQEAEHDRLLAEIDQAKARVAQVESRIAKFTITAPFRARAGIRTIHEGQYLREGTEVVMLEEVADKTFLDFAIPQEYLSRVKIGTVVMGQSAAISDQPIRLEVSAIDATVNNDTRNVRVRATVDNSAGLLRPGMFVQIRVPVSDPQPFTVVPSTAVRRSSYAEQVFLVDNVPPPLPEWQKEMNAKAAAAALGAPAAPAHGSAAHGGPPMPPPMFAHQRFVKLGASIGNKVIILEGLKPGDAVAATGAFKLSDGALVMAVTPGGGMPGPSGAPAATVSTPGAKPASSPAEVAKQDRASNRSPAAP
ncbi:efflux RND transporter periplasmic adaptor subunit [soil metagenome]